MSTQQTFATAITHIDSPRRLLPLWALRAITHPGQWHVNRPASSVCYESLLVVTGVAWRVLTANSFLMLILFNVNKYTISLFSIFFFIIKMCAIFTEE